MKHLNIFLLQKKNSSIDKIEQILVDLNQLSDQITFNDWSMCSSDLFNIIANSLNVRLLKASPYYKNASISI